jgi:2,5-dihydroxypyridine 5,6-dioxygenase
MMQPSSEMVALFRAELELCKVGPGQVMAVLSAGAVRADYAQAFMIAGRDLGAEVFHLNLPPKASAVAKYTVGRTPLSNNRPAIEALKAADIVIDLLGLLFSKEQNEITATGTRVLMVLEPMSVLQQMFPTEEQRRRVEAAGVMMSQAKSLHVTSAAGTDIRYGLSQYPVLTEYGYTDEPGRWDHWPSGFLLTQGNDEDIEGTIMIMPGDILNAFRRYVQTPVKMTVERGKVVAIEGDGMDATLIKSYIESFDDERAYAISHIGWGMNERANWHHMANTRELDAELGMNALAFYGNVLVSLGPNSEVGGTNDTACHLDIPLRNCDLHLDGAPIVLNGKIIPEILRAPGR